MQKIKSSFILHLFLLTFKFSPLKSSILIVAILLSALTSMVSPVILGFGVSSIGTTGQSNAKVTVLWFAILYGFSWFIGACSKYLVLPIYGSIEQSVQSQMMKDSLSESLSSDSRARASVDNNQIAFAIDAKAAAFRDTFSNIYLVLLPAIASITFGLIFITTINSIVEGIIFGSSVVIYLALSLRMIRKHHQLQSEFFASNMESFGQLSNYLKLWKEAKVFSGIGFVANRYRAERTKVENRAEASYRATRNLNLVQGLVIALTIAALIISVGIGSELNGNYFIAAIVSSTGICISALSPLQDVGFGLSAIGVAKAQTNESDEKIRLSESNLEPILNPVRKEVQRQMKIHRKVRGIIWVTGPSGSGKTTLLEDLVFSAQQRRDSISYAQQTPVLLADTAVENIEFGRKTADAEESLFSLGLSSFGSQGERYANHVEGENSGVSGGEKQRIALARALTAPRDCLFVLDEPTSSLDAQSKELVWQFIKRMSEESLFVIATHDSSAPISEYDQKIQLK